MTEFEYILKKNELLAAATKKRVGEIFRESANTLSEYGWSYVIKTNQEYQEIKYNYLLATHSAKLYTGATTFPQKLQERILTTQFRLLTYIVANSGNYTDYIQTFEYAEAPLRLTRYSSGIHDLIKLATIIGDNEITYPINCQYSPSSKFSSLIEEAKTDLINPKLPYLAEFIHYTKHLDLRKYTLLQQLHNEILAKVKSSTPKHTPEDVATEIKSIYETGNLLAAELAALNE